MSQPTRPHPITLWSLPSLTLPLPLAVQRFQELPAVLLTFDLQASAVTGLICLAGLSASLLFHLRAQPGLTGPS